MSKKKETIIDLSLKCYSIETFKDTNLWIDTLRKKFVYLSDFSKGSFEKNEFWIDLKNLFNNSKSVSEKTNITLAKSLHEEINYLNFIIVLMKKEIGIDNSKVTISEIISRTNFANEVFLSDLYYKYFRVYFSLSEFQSLSNFQQRLLVTQNYNGWNIIWNYLNNLAPKLFYYDTHRAIDQVNKDEVITKIYEYLTEKLRQNDFYKDPCYFFIDLEKQVKVGIRKIVPKSTKTNKIFEIEKTNKAKLIYVDDFFEDIEEYEVPSNLNFDNFFFVFRNMINTSHKLDTLIRLSPINPSKNNTDAFLNPKFAALLFKEKLSLGIKRDKRIEWKELIDHLRENIENDDIVYPEFKDSCREKLEQDQVTIRKNYSRDVKFLFLGMIRYYNFHGNVNTLIETKDPNDDIILFSKHIPKDSKVLGTREFTKRVFEFIDEISNLLDQEKSN